MPFNADREGKRLPIKLDSTSNGEFVPIPLDATSRRANRLAHTWALKMPSGGVDRRTLMVSACGADSTLLAFNVATSSTAPTGFENATRPYDVDVDDQTSTSRRDRTSSC